MKRPGISGIILIQKTAKIFYLYSVMETRPHKNILFQTAIVLTLMFSQITLSQEVNSDKTNQLHWYKGNTHTHTLNSDGDSTPDEVVRWYREHGYNFLVLSDHNFLTGVEGLNAIYGAEAQFIVIKGEEITNRFGDKPIHVNGLNIDRLIPPQGGSSVVETIQRNGNSVRKASGV
ncbi:MAG: PHP domain-containing protein, partial [Calditrichia bacterium]